MTSGDPPAPDPLPTFVRDRPITRAALTFAAHAHRGDEREGDRAPFILHPLEAASLLASTDCPDEVTAAAVLHDTLEDTGATAEQIQERFGVVVAGLVQSVTEDPDIADDGARRSALREQIAQAGPDAGRIFAADKLSKVREFRIRLGGEPSFAADPDGQAKMEHYWQSLDVLERRMGSEPLVRQLRFELEAIRALPPIHTSRTAMDRAVPPGMEPD